LLEHFDESYHPLVKVAKTAGIEAVQALLEEAGGTKPHLPTWENFQAILQREVRNEAIRDAFNGRNYDQLEMEYGLKERQLRQIIHGKPRNYQRHNEPSKTIKVSDEHHERLELLAEDYGSTVRAITDAVLTAALEHKDVHAALRKACGGEQVRMALDEAA
jgi:transaldolase